MTARQTIDDYEVRLTILENTVSQTLKTLDRIDGRLERLESKIDYGFHESRKEVVEGQDSGFNYFFYFVIATFVILLGAPLIKTLFQILGV